MSTALMALASASVLALTGIVFCGTAVLALARRRALILQSRWLLYLLVAATLPPISAGLARMQAGAADLLTVAPALLAGLVLVCALLRLKGFWVVGVAPQSLGRDLAVGLQAQGLGAVDGPSGLHLQGLDADLEVRVQPWLGTATLRVVPEARERELRGPLMRLAISGSAPTFHGLAAISGVALLVLGAWVLSSPTPEPGSALGFIDSAAAPTPSLLGITTMLLAGLLVCVSMCHEHLICLLALGSLILWAYSF